MNEITRIAVDGGPCSGKSTGMAHIAKSLVEVGIMPILVPESATLLIKGGITPWDLDVRDFQKRVAELQMSTEGIYMAGASAFTEKYKRRCVLLCDRGLVGAAAYFRETRTHE